jgi:hypothetical protein
MSFVTSPGTGVRRLRDEEHNDAIVLRDVVRKSR